LALNGNGNGASKLVYWILGSVFVIAMTVIGILVNSQDNRMTMLENRYNNHMTGETTPGLARISVLETKIVELERRIDRLDR